MVPDSLHRSPCRKMESTFSRGVQWKAKETVGSAPPCGRTAATKRSYAGEPGPDTCGLWTKVPIKRPDDVKARPVMFSTLRRTSAITSGVSALSCGVACCCHGAESDTMRFTPLAICQRWNLRGLGIRDLEILGTSSWTLGGRI